MDRNENTRSGSYIFNHQDIQLAISAALSRSVLGLFCAALFAAVLPQLYAQAQSSLHGTVFDPGRAVIAGAKITVVPEGAGNGPSTVSDQNGEFFLALQPGRYAVHISMAGFAELSQVVDLAGSTDRQTHDFILQLAGVQQMVTVSESSDYQISAISTATRTLTPMRDIPQSLAVVTQQQVHDQLMLSVGDVVRYIPGITAHQGENNRDQLIIRGNNTSADFFVNGVRDDVQYYRDLYNVERIEALKGPNAMVFGRGGGGGVINRVIKDAGFMPLREITIVGGSYRNKRLTADLDQPLTDRLAFRVNGLYENSDSFRRYTNLERYGVNPTLTLMANTNTRVTLGYEHFHDYRVADRGIPSFQGLPLDIDISTYFGNPDVSHVRARVDLGSATIEHQAGRLNIHDQVSLGDYDRGYQNFVPGVVSADETQAGLSAYNNATRRFNTFNQTNLTYGVSTGRIRHTLAGGAEIGRQLTDNFRNTGYFNNSATSILIPLSNPTISTPVTFRQSATDANNHLQTNLAATYVQDQIEFSRHLQMIAGARFDYFDLQYHDNRTGTNLRRIDNLISPRAGVILKPTTALSLYGSYSVSYLPGSGDQFSSLTTITQQVKPEKFNNYEAGVKWDIYRDLSFTTAVYRLDRTNTRTTDPNDPTRIVQTGRTRSNGYEAGLNGRVTRAWSIAGGYAYQNAFIASATTSAPAGAQVAEVPHRTFSVWNNYQIMPKWRAGLGVLRRSDMFAAIDDTVTLPGYTRADAAVYFSVTEKMRLQANVENLFNKRYYLNADSNANISPGSPRALRVGFTAEF
jgi:catecholate siderophore receptor